MRRVFPKKIIVLQEDGSTGAGLFAAACEKAGVVLRAVEAARAGRIPRELPPDSGLLVMGGHLTIPDLESCPFIGKWVDLIRRAIEFRNPLLGVGSGAILIARALGTGIRPAPEPEIGWGTVTLTEDGIADPLFSGLPVYLPVFQWRIEEIDLPRESVGLAGSPSSPHQAFRHGTSAYGILFHLEATEAMVRAWCSARERFLGGVTAAQKEKLEDPFLDREAHARRGIRFFENFLKIFTSKRVFL